MRVLINCILLTLVSWNVAANEIHDIQFEIGNYTENKVIIGYYYGDQTLVLDTLVSNNNVFQLQGDSLLKQGVYLMLTVPDNKFVQFIVNGEDQVFKMSMNVKDLSKVKVKGSNENKLFYNYLNFLGKQREKSEIIKAEIATAKTAGQDTTKIKSKFSKIDLEVSQRQNKIIAENPKSIAAILIGANRQVEVPDFTGSPEEVNEQKYLYIKEHYFDGIDFDNPAIIRTPLIHKKIDYFINKLTTQSPDSLIKTVDKLLDEFQSNEDLRKYYLIHFLNSFAKSKIVGMDAVYVHIAEQYYATDQADWLKEEALNKIIKNAKKLKPILIGKTAPDFKLYREDDSIVHLKEIKSDYTLLFFWAPDCGHCEKAIPPMKEFKDSDHGLDITFLTICNKIGDKYKTCWEAIEKKGLQSFINLGDQYQKSRILSNYYVKRTPKIFILDKDKKILIKNIGTSNLLEVFQELERRKRLFLQTAE